MFSSSIVQFPFHFLPILDGRGLPISIRATVPDPSPILVGHFTTDASDGSVSRHVRPEHPLGILQACAIFIRSGDAGVDPARSMDLERTEGSTVIARDRPESAARLDLVNRIDKFRRRVSVKRSRPTEYDPDDSCTYNPDS
jgi:hypothetical protein